MSCNAEQYARLVQVHHRALALLQIDLEFFLEESGPILLIAVEGRVKPFESAAQKSNKLNIDVSELDDLAGLRLTCAPS